MEITALVIDIRLLLAARSPAEFASFMHVGCDPRLTTRYIVSHLAMQETLNALHGRLGKYANDLCYELWVDVGMAFILKDGKFHRTPGYGMSDGNEYFDIRVYAQEFWETGSAEKDFEASGLKSQESFACWLAKKVELVDPDGSCDGTIAVVTGAGGQDGFQLELLSSRD